MSHKHSTTDCDVVKQGKTVPLLPLNQLQSQSHVCLSSFLSAEVSFGAGKIKEQVDLLFPWKNNQTHNFPER
jgi:hypothetical protein